MHACITGCILNSGSRREVTRAAALNGGLQATGFPLLQRFLVSVVKHTQSGELLLNDSLSVEQPGPVLGNWSCNWGVPVGRGSCDPFMTSEALSWWR